MYFVPMMIRYKMMLILLVIVFGANIALGEHPHDDIHHHHHPEIHHDYSIPPQHLDQHHLDPHNFDPHHLDSDHLEQQQENHGEEGKDPIVGVGLGIPIVDALALGAKAKAAVLTSVAGAHALSLKARADIHRRIQEAKIHHDLLSARARANVHNALYYGHHPILGAANHEAGPEDTKEAIMQEVDEAMSDYPREVTENVGLMHDLLSHPIVKRSNLKRDEELFGWSLNNGNNFRSADSESPRDSYNVKLLGNTDFWKNHQITKQTPIDNYFPTGLKHTESDSLISVYPGDWKPDSQDGINDYKITPSSFDLPDKLREANPDTRHFKHHFFHKRPFGFHPGNQQPQVDHWGKPINPIISPGINPGISPVNSGIDFNSFTPNGLDLLHVKPTQVTINNQQNTFSNAVSGGSSGNQKIQVSQTNGPGSSQQVSSASSEFVSSPYLLHFPEYRRSHHKKRSLKSDLKSNILTNEDIKFIDRLHKEYWNELKVNDWNAIKKSKRPNNEIFKLRPLMIEAISRKKRSLPLLRLMADPNAKLDMPKTLENVGTIARNSFEDKKAPMYHVKNFVGSTKNAVLSALKMAPQELIIPSQYKIVDTSKDVVMKPAEVAAIKARAQAQLPPAATVDLRPKTLKERFEMWRLQKAPKMESKMLQKIEPILGQAAPVQPQDPIVDTFQKFGSVIRDSIKSGHETMQHISDAAHSARKVFTTARFAAPRVLLPYTRAPTLQRDNKLMLISPRFLDIADDDQIKHEPNYVKMGDLMDAFGVSNPENEKVGLRRIIIQKNKPSIAEASFPLLQSRFGGDEENDETVEKVNKFYVISEDIEEDDMENALQSIKDAIGVESVKEFLQEMKNDFNTMRENIKKNEIVKSQPPKVSKVDVEDAELDEFLRDMFKQQQEEQDKEKVGIGLNLPENLLKPFMAQPSNDELAQFFRDNGDDEEERKYVPNLCSRSFVSAINPELYKEKFNETLQIDSEANVKNPEKFFVKDSNSSVIVGSSNPLDEDERRTSMKFHDKLLKPFLGKVDVSEEYGMPFDGYYQRPYNDDDDGYEDYK